MCRASGLLECVNQTCGEGEICEVRDGQRDCYTDQGQCVFDASDQLRSFDGVKGAVERPGAYQMAFLCNQESPDWFRVVLDVHACARNDSGYVTMVHVFFQDMIITVNHKHSWVSGILIFIYIVLFFGTLTTDYSDCLKSNIESAVDIKQLRMYFSLKQVNGKKVSYPIMPKEGFQSPTKMRR